ncbi:MAG: hypothetical protein R3D44_00405 [Hyphomicrobiaceae bacterium]
MATAIMEGQLRAALEADRELGQRGCHVVPRRPNGVAIERGVAELGVWYWKNGQFELSIAGDHAVVRVDTVAEAVRHTREKLFGPGARS